MSQVLSLGGSGKGINWAPPGAAVVGPGRGSGAVPGAVIPNPAESGRVLVWLQGIPGKVSTHSGKVPVPSAEATALSGVRRKSDYKTNP